MAVYQAETLKHKCKPEHARSKKKLTCYVHNRMGVGLYT